MAIECERKYLVNSDFRPHATASQRITQGYLSTSPTVRIRLYGTRGFITIKSKSLDGGLSRHEWEYEIPASEAEQMLRLCNGVIDKERYIVPFEGQQWEVDVFHGANEGLIVAEIELSSPDEVVATPPWRGKEVTGDVRYYNSHLTQHPFAKWNKSERSIT